MKRLFRSGIAATIALGVLAAPLLSTSPASALPGNGVGGGLFPSRTDVTSGTRADSAHDYLLKINGGLYVIGDSISRRPGDSPTGGVPYAFAAAAVLKAKQSAVRAYDGADSAGHRTGIGWDYAGRPGDDYPAVQSKLPTAQDAARSDASTVFIELGTNDMSCLHRSTRMGPATASQICDTLAKDDNDPGYADWKQAQLTKIYGDAAKLVDDLVAARKCVIWAGPREVDIYGTRAAEYAAFNDFLIAYSRLKAGFHYADLDYYAKHQPDMIADWGRTYNGQYDVHQHTQATSVALANFAVLSATIAPSAYTSSPTALWPTGGCGMAKA